MSRAIDSLFQAAHARGLDVLLEKPGHTLRLALQTTRARVRAGAVWYRRFVRMDEVKGSDVEDAATVLLGELERTPPTTGESRA